MKKSGIIAIIGRPNVGKSTLLNSILKQKVTIVTNKPETTRENVRGILTLDDSQMVFIDTPGAHKPKNLLDKLMVSGIQSSLLEADVILFLTEKNGIFRQEDERIIVQLKRLDDKPVLLLINKIDTVKSKSDVLPIIDKATRLFPFKEIVPICSKNEEEATKIVAMLEKFLPEQDFLYDATEVSDKDDSFVIRETIREKLLLETHEEVPHASAVIVDKIERSPDNRLKVSARIIIDKASQKGIILGKDGVKIKRVKMLSEQELRRVLSVKRVKLQIWIDVHPNWKKDTEILGEIGIT